MESARYEVVVVGGGPVGLACALDLALRGIRCAVVEPRVETHHIPKGQNLTQRSLEHFARWKIAERVRARRVLPRDHPIGGAVIYGDLRSPFWHAPPGREALTRFFAEANERLPQYLTEAVMRERVAELDDLIELYLGDTVTDLVQDDECVTVQLDDGRRLQAAYLVGCDGTGSPIRRQLEIPFEWFGPTRTMALIVFASTQLHDRLAAIPTRTTYRIIHPDLGGFWRMFGRVDERETWFFHGPVDDDQALDDAAAARVLTEAAGVDFDSEIEYAARWEARTAVAGRYRDGRIFIAGDACHAHPPYGGFGLNSGLEDAVNLSWKLAATLRGWGSEALLDSYTLERRPVFDETAREVIHAWIEHDRVFLAEWSPDADPVGFETVWKAQMAVSDTGPPWYEPHYEGSPMVAGPRCGRSGVFGEYSMRARPGHHFATRPLSDGTRSFDALGTGFTLFAFDVAEAVVERWTHAAQRLGVPLTVRTDSWLDERREYGSRLVLVRPDRYVAWVGDGSTGVPEQALARAIGRAGEPEIASAAIDAAA